jgi:hypothetical protein
MNTPITFPPGEPALKLARPSAEKWAATLAEERRRLQEDQNSLREREENLREYEARLRALQAEIEAGRANPAPVAAAPAARGAASSFTRPSSRAPFHDDPALQLAWEKLHRARELLEAEERNMRDDRIALREYDVQLKQREASVRAREEILAEREAALVAATPPPQPMAGEHTMSAVTKLTRAPFNMARSVFRGKK